MSKFYKSIALVTFFIAVNASFNCFGQTKDAKILISKRVRERKAMHSRDSLLRSFNKNDTSISSLLQRIEQYTTTYNQIKNSLASGLDTALLSQELPQTITALDKISSVANTHKSSTLRYLAVLRDNLDHIQKQLDGWQDDLEDINSKLVQNQNDLLKFSKDTVIKAIPADSMVRAAIATQLRDVKILWRKTDSINRKSLLKVNLIQDKISVSFTKALDESDQVDAKIKGFALKAIAGETGFIWEADPVYSDFNSAFKSTIRLNKLLFNYFVRNEKATHLVGFLFLILTFSWIVYSRKRALKDNENPNKISVTANYIFKNPIISSLLVVTAITPYFYVHPPTVFLEVFFLISIIFSFLLIRKEIQKSTFSFLIALFAITVGYAVSNLFIQISNIDRYFIFLLSILSIIIGAIFYKKLKNITESPFPYTLTVVSVFIGFHIFSLLLNITGRFSLAKIIGVTAVFNFWMLIILYLVINIVIEALFLQFQIKRGEKSFINWIDYDLVQKKFRNTLVIGSSMLWLFFLLQNLNIDDWATDYGEDILNQAHSVGGASFTFGGFVIFVFVIWLSSIASKVISYFYDVSSRRVTDLSVFKRKNQTSALIIRIGVFAVGFLLAVSASNFPLDKLTIIISAFGVGIGFGLQNIVNNLVSGLILAFEKPIQIGDIIAVDGHTGTMKEIGIRSSKVVTGDGSEVIIPNGDLISHQVVNWTLSNTNRQIELKVVTAYGVDINSFKGILINLLSNRDDIMSEPAPAVLVNSVNENAVEFRVLFWLADITTTGSLKSLILTEIYQVIDKEGVQLPATQKDFNVHFPDGVPIIDSGDNTTERKKQRLS